MKGEADAVEMDAVLGARRVARRAKLLEQARGKGSWREFPWILVVLAAWAAYQLWSIAKADGGLVAATAVAVGAMILLTVVGWSEWRLRRRIDAIVELIAGDSATDL